MADATNATIRTLEAELDKLRAKKQQQEQPSGLVHPAQWDGREFCPEFQSEEMRHGQTASQTRSGTAEHALWQPTPSRSTTALMAAASEPRPKLAGLEEPWKHGT